MAIVETHQTGDGATRITLNRPEKANALNEAMIEALLDAFAVAQASSRRSSCRPYWRDRSPWRRQAGRGS